MADAPPVAILIVDDRKAELATLAKALAPVAVPILAAKSEREALRLAEQQEIAVAVIDIRMPALEGFSIVEALRNDPRRVDLPVIFVSEFELTPAVLQRVYQLGAADVVPLPVMPEMLLSKVTVFVRLHRETAKARAYARQISDAAATEVRAQEERFRLLLEAISDYAVFFMDPLGLVSDWTISAERLLRYPARETMGKHFRFIFTAEDLAKGKPESELEVAITRGQSHDDTVHVRGDGSLLPVTGRTIALRERDGTLRGFAKIMRDATDLRALQESEAKFREIFETANEGIWILDADGTIKVANRRIAELLGYNAPEMMGRQKTDFVFPEDLPYVRTLFEERRTGKLQSGTELRFRHRNGSAVWTLLSARPIYRDGKFAGALDMFTDITARRLAEDRFRVFFESSAAGHALLDPQTGRFLTTNRRFSEIAGRSLEELRTLTFRDITHPDDRAADDERFRRLRDGDVAEVLVEKRYLRPDGTAVWVSLTSTIVRDPRGQPEIQISVIQDITARKWVESELIESRMRLRLATEAADLGVFYHNTADDSVSWNPQMTVLLGVKPENVQSAAAFLERVHPEDRRFVADQIRRISQVAEGPQEIDFEYRILRADGTVRWLRANALSEARVVNGKSGVSIIGTVLDVTRTKEFEAELRRQIDERTRELEQKNRQLESFCYTVAHDLRAPLRAINGYADLGLEELRGSDRPQTVGFLERIRTSTRRLDELITDLLAFSRINQIEIEREPVELRRVIDIVRQELGPEIKQRNATVTVADRIPVVVGEPSVLEQVVLNLVGNALKFSRPGEPPHLEIRAEDRGDRVRLKVRDNGIGIPREYHERIFRVFERLQASRNYPGTGIGLAIVARGMERLGGTYGVESEPDKGSTFWIELPRADA